MHARTDINADTHSRPMPCKYTCAHCRSMLGNPSACSASAATGDITCLCNLGYGGDGTYCTRAFQCHREREREKERDRERQRETERERAGSTLTGWTSRRSLPSGGSSPSRRYSCPSGTRPGSSRPSAAGRASVEASCGDRFGESGALLSM